MAKAKCVLIGRLLASFQKPLKAKLEEIKNKTNQFRVNDLVAFHKDERDWFRWVFILTISESETLIGQPIKTQFEIPCEGACSR